MHACMHARTYAHVRADVKLNAANLEGSAESEMHVTEIVASTDTTVLVLMKRLQTLAHIAVIAGSCSDNTIVVLTCSHSHPHRL
jgi:hypothetical protein